MEPRPNRGRAKGRSRPPEQSGGGARPGQAPPGMGPRPAGAWGGGPPRGGQPQSGGRPPQPMGGGIPQTQQPVVQPQGAWGARQAMAQQIRTPAPPPSSTLAGRASYRGAGGDVPGAVPTERTVVAGSGAGDASHSGRGALRGRRVLHENILRTKPDHITSKKGTGGRPVQLSANYFSMPQKPDWCLFQYRVDFAPDDDQTSNRKRLLRTAIKDMDLSGYIFDGTVMYTSRRLERSPMELWVDPILDGGERVRVTIKLVGDVNKGDYHYLQIFNIIMRKCMQHLKLQLVGRNFYDAIAKINVPEWNMELWPGYVTSIRQHESSILLCCEISHKFMRNETVHNVFMECMRDGRNFKQEFAKRVVGTVVLTDYNNKTYRIDDVDFNTSPSSTFQRKDGSSISYVQYYRERYGITITQMDQPMLVSNPKPNEIRGGMAETIILVPELCRCTGLTDQHRSNMQLMRSLANHTRVGPMQRIEKLQNFSRRLMSNPQIMAELKQWDLQLANNIVQISGRVLPTEKLHGGGQGNEYSAGKDVDWTRELRSRKMFVEGNLRNWAVIYPARTKPATIKFVQMVEKAAQGMNWRIGKPRPYEIADDRIGTYLQGLDDLCSKEQFDQIMCVVTNNKNDRYGAIKKKTLVDKAIPTQVMCARNLDSKGAMSIATKVAIQMNCKVGGAPWTVNIPLGNIMIVGYDVCHDPTNKSRSFGAMVASLDKNITRYFSTATPHTNGEELSNDFALQIVRACKEYKTLRGCYPERIIIFRDGVGDGQLPFVYEHEVKQIAQALQGLFGEPAKLAFIVVAKRINTRIFAGAQNPDPGTVVDDVITLPERYDFFLVSQCTRQGTVSPTSYNIIYDTFGLPADKLQILTYKLTHMYFNWSGTVRVPAPCQYAHKLAFLVAQSLQRSPNPALETLLYYL